MSSIFIQPSLSDSQKEISPVTLWDLASPSSLNVLETTLFLVSTYAINHAHLWPAIFKKASGCTQWEGSRTRRQNASSGLRILDTSVFLALIQIAWICVKRGIEVFCLGGKVGSRRDLFRALLSFPSPESPNRLQLFSSCSSGLFLWPLTVY